MLTRPFRPQTRAVRSRRPLARSALTATVVVVSVSLLTACGGPTTKAEVCDSFDKTGRQLFQGNGIIGNPLFHDLDDLSDVASRYPGPPDLSGDSDRLHALAKADSVDGNEIENASLEIAGLCGHPMGIGMGLGGM